MMKSLQDCCVEEFDRTLDLFGSDIAPETAASNVEHLHTVLVIAKTLASMLDRTGVDLRTKEGVELALRTGVLVGILGALKYKDQMFDQIEIVIPERGV